MDELAIDVNGERLALDPSGALYWPAEKTLVFADLHLEKGSSFARRGALLPPYDTRETLARMRDAIVRRKATRVIALGDSFHDREAADRLDETERALLRSLVDPLDWIWIAGNHDPTPPSWLGGTIASEVAIGRLVFRHEPCASVQPGEVAGHLHPCTTVVRRSRALRRRCFVSGGGRLLLPAFGAYTGGLDVVDAAIAGLFPASFLTYVMGARRVYAVASVPDAHRFWRKKSEEIQPSNAAIATAETP